MYKSLPSSWLRQLGTDKATERESPMSMSKPNILFITIDTLRADHLGCYGYPHNTSPNIDVIAEEGILCEKFFCSGIPTQPSYTTMLTGQHPITHQIVAHGGQNQLSKEAPFLPQLLLPAGYTTCAVDNLIQERAWFSRGFEFYIDPSVRRTLMLGVSCEELNARAIPWLRTHAHEPFFLFMHYWDPHWPLTPPKRYQHLFYNGNSPVDPGNRSLEEWWEHPLGQIAKDTWLRTEHGLITDPDYVVAMYDQEIRHVDDGVGELLSVLDDLGLTENTLVVLVADHGESMTEHGIFFAHHGLYDPVIRIPCIFRMPGTLQKGYRLPQLLSNEDIALTILEAIGVPPHSAMDGNSFWKELTQTSDNGSHPFIITSECTWQAKWSMRTAQHKFILARTSDFYGNPPKELYDLEQDPEEKENIVDLRKGLSQKMELELETWIATKLSEMGRTEDPLIREGASLGGMRGIC
ncbi:MAG: sulfatase [Desulfobacteraceae bacterium]